MHVTTFSQSAKTYDSPAVKSIFALLSPKVTKAKASFIRITLAYHVPGGANVPQVPVAPCGTSGTLGTWCIDLLCKKITRAS